MASIDVLPALGKPAAKTGTEQGISSMDGQSAAAQFAAILGGWMTLMMGGQGSDNGNGSSKESSANFEVGKSGEAKTGNVPDFELQKLWAGLIDGQAFRGIFPAGKEANSGEQQNQSGSMLVSANGLNVNFNPLLTGNTLVGAGVERTGMMPLNPKGTETTELDEYKVIAKLLQDLSGEIKNISLPAGRTQEAQIPQLDKGVQMHQLAQGLQMPQLQGTLISQLDGMLQPNPDIQANEADQGIPVQGTLDTIMIQKLKDMLGRQGINLDGQEVGKLTDTSKAQGFNPITVLENSVSVPSEKSSTLMTDSGNFDKSNLAIGEKTSDKATHSEFSGLAQDRLNVNHPYITTVAKADSAPSVTSDNTVIQLSLSKQGNFNESGAKEDKGKDNSNNNNSERNGRVELIEKQDALTPFNINNSLSSLSKPGTPMTVQGEERSLAQNIWHQVASFVQNTLHEKRSEVKALEIQLHPAELGKIQVNLHWEGDQVHMQVQASEEATGKILNSHLQDLRQALEHAGVACGNLQMGFSGEQRRNPWQGGFNPSKFVKQNEPGEVTVPIQEIHYSQNLLGENRLNVTA